MKRARVSGKPIENAIVDAMAITDAEAPIVTDRKRQPRARPRPPRRRERPAVSRSRRESPLRARRKRTASSTGRCTVPAMMVGLCPVTTDRWRFQDGRACAAWV
jgi:hypothetical protein